MGRHILIIVFPLLASAIVQATLGRKLQLAVDYADPKKNLNRLAAR